uniref:Uncharacterized protein n=1 Tax=Rhizophora mucronata TaxID=61149 RepID=A0A2P2JYI2_RHIMU
MLRTAEREKGVDPSISSPIIHPFSPAYYRH